MIKLLTPDRTAEFIALCSDSPTGAGILTRLAAYGADSGIQYFWFAERGGEMTAAYNRDSSLLNICGTPDSDGETAQFVQFAGCREVMSDNALSLPGFAAYADNVSILSALPGGCLTAEDVTAEDVKNLFDVIYEDMPQNERSRLFEYWYPDVSLKIRRGLIRGKMTVSDSRVVSCALTSGESAHCAVISSVATLRNERRKGYGFACVAALAGSLICEGKDVYAVTDNEKNRQWYESMGFAVRGFRYRYVINK